MSLRKCVHYHNLWERAGVRGESCVYACQRSVVVKFCKDFHTYLDERHPNYFARHMGLFLFSSGGSLAVIVHGK